MEGQKLKEILELLRVKDKEKVAADLGRESIGMENLPILVQAVDHEELEELDRGLRCVASLFKDAIISDEERAAIRRGVWRNFLEKDVVCCG